jgi:hypothetical protein
MSYRSGIAGKSFGAYSCYFDGFGAYSAPRGNTTTDLLQ